MIGSETNQDQNTFSAKNLGLSGENLSKITSNWSTIAPIALSGLWVLRKFPKTTLIALAAVGGYIAYQKDVGGIKKAFEAEDAHLH